MLEMAFCGFLRTVSKELQEWNPVERYPLGLVTALTTTVTIECVYKQTHIESLRGILRDEDGVALESRQADSSRY